jgi:pilus assembly protein Flp/PilA
MKKIILFFSDDNGASAVEYGMMIALIAIVIIATVSLLGEKINEMFEFTRAEMAK